MIKIIRKVEKKELKEFLYNISTEDSQVYSVLKGSPIGVFQFSGGTAEGITKRVKPENFEDIVAINAFARPGTINFLPQYLENRETGTSPYPKKVQEVLKNSWYVALYQESAMAIFNKIGGFSLLETDRVRGLMKRLGKADKRKEDIDSWNETIKRFEEGAVKNGLSKAEARNLAEDILAMASYNFNRCFSGDSVIDRDNSTRWSPTIEEMYLTKNDKEWAIKNGHESLNYKYNKEGYKLAFSLNSNGNLYPNEIVDIRFEGKKDVFLIELENGKSIKVTSNHNFPLMKDDTLVYKNIDSGLKVGDSLFSNEGYKKDFTERYNYNFSGETVDTREFKNYEGCGFKDGEENSGFINGKYAEFKKNFEIKKEQSGGVCEKCGGETGRIEIHHVDFDKLNNDLSNLKALCPSCHKKEHYRNNGRVRKNEKGKSTKLVKIIKISLVGKENTYDVEMKAPYHTLSVNGIVAKNSHAVAYSFVGFMCMYMTFYFKPYFYSAIIEHGMDKTRSDMPSLLKSIRDSGHNVVAPNINNSKTKTYSSGKDIIVGIHNLKQIGIEAADSIINMSPYGSFRDFLAKTLLEAKVNKRAISSLVKFGCFDKVESDISRRQMVNAFEEFWKIKPTVNKKLALKDTNIEERSDVVRYLESWDTVKQKWKNNELLLVSTEYLKEMENETLGFNFFISPFSEKEMKTFEEGEKRGLLKTKFDNIELINITWKVPVFIETMRIIKDKNGNEMAFINIEDMAGSTVSVPVFSSMWQYLSDKIYAKSVCLLSVYRNDRNQIMLGMNGWVRNEGTIRGFSMPIRRTEG